MTGLSYPSKTTDRSSKILTSDVARIVKEFIDLDPSVDYFKMNDVNERLEDAMRAEIRSRNIVSVRLDKTIHLAASLIELAFKDCTFEEKTNMALYNWFILYTDDASTKNVTPFVEFQQRFFRQEQQLDQVLDAFADVLRRMCRQYSALFGNLFLSATFEFITATCAEPGIEALPVLRGAKRFPTFLRDRTGLGVPYALMVYPNSRSMDFVTCFQALPDMNFWIAAINDLLSFYKEELAGETVNYIYNRAKVDNSNPLHVLLTIRDELLEASDNVTRALSGHAPAALKAWKDFEAGVM
ncbi:hypothetical protein H0H87_007733 [Tephrocybe sp. NHM501043]|nr:hypothetical protein H0H87_007733 [Tephrocybe sp. NHM501043]